jgi:hypothetical protein
LDGFLWSPHPQEPLVQLASSKWDNIAILLENTRAAFILRYIQLCVKRASSSSAGLQAQPHAAHAGIAAACRTSAAVLYAPAVSIAAGIPAVPSLEVEQNREVVESPASFPTGVAQALGYFTASTESLPIPAHLLEQSEKEKCQLLKLSEKVKRILCLLPYILLADLTFWCRTRN